MLYFTDQNIFISVRAAAQKLGVATITMYRLVERGEIPSVRLGSRRLIPAKFIDQLAEKALGQGAK